MQSHIDYTGLRSVSVNTSDFHARSLQDTLDVGSPTPSVGKALDCVCSKVYRPTIGFYRNTYITDDYGNSIKVSAKQFSKVCHNLDLTPSA